MSEQLLPCPFCGGEAEFERHGSNYPPRCSCIVRCTECGCSMESSDAGFTNGSAWNRRAPSPLQAENDELREALRAVLGTVNNLKACVPEYHGSPLEESVNDDLRPVRALLARHGTQAATGKDSLQVGRGKER